MPMRLRTSVLARVGLVMGLTAAVLMQSTDAEASDYLLRFPGTFGKEGYITQAYNGSSHQNQDYYALDVDVEWGGTLGARLAAAHGQVVDSVTGRPCGFQYGYGNYVVTKTTITGGELRYALYGHLSSVSVSVNQTIPQGRKVGVEGDSGYTVGSQPNGCGAHLHFRWASEQNCFSQDCPKVAEPMSGQTGFATGQTWTSDNTEAACPGGGPWSGWGSLGEGPPPGPGGS